MVRISGYVEGTRCAPGGPCHKGTIQSSSYFTYHTDIFQAVHIEDVGSMHGTYVEDRKLAPHTRERLFSGDYIKFGAEVTRGPGTCWINDEPAPYCCSQPIRWLPLCPKGHFFNALSEPNPLPESFPPLDMYISFNWVDEPYVTTPLLEYCN